MNTLAFYWKHANAINEEDPLVHLEILHVQRSLQFDELDGFNNQIVEDGRRIFNLPFENTD